MGHGAALALDGRGQSVERPRVGEVPAHVVKPCSEPVEDVRAHGLATILDRLSGVVAEMRSAVVQSSMATPRIGRRRSPRRSIGTAPTAVICFAKSPVMRT
jgi:hypothetical protein